ncbi:MAG: hypothetical protein ACK54K_18030 [Gemmatimonadaceae bacterium]
MGFESSLVARRRLAARAATKHCIQEALDPQGFPPLHATPVGRSEPMGGPFPASATALVQQLDHLAHDIMATPGAGGALIAAYAAQARALTLVVEAAQRAGSAPLPASVIAAARDALAANASFQGLMAG